MQKERLFISERKVTVDYDFFNESDKDITTEIAFPVPPFGVYDTDCGPRSTFDDFRVWIDDKKKDFATEDHAIVSGTDQTQLLRKLNIDIATFGAYWGPPEKCRESETSQIDKLSAQDKAMLIQVGLLNNDHWPKWKVFRTHHWTQTFPSRKTMHIRHEYAPGLGYHGVQLEDLYADTRKEKIAEALARPKGSPGSESDESYLYMAKEVDELCVDPSLARKIKEVESERWKAGAQKYGAPPFPVEVDHLNVGVEWVEYILSTANSWKGPIKDFTLLVERPTAEGGGGPNYFVSFCWNGPVRRVDENHFEAHVTNFVPRKELHVGFFFPNP